VLQTVGDDERPTNRIVLAHEPEFTLGALQICPAKREVMAGTACEVLQPRIMQVLIVLARRRGEVVTRDELIRHCWEGYAVSDDAIHRCIGRIRRLAEAHGGFTLKTIPRVGYQLIEVGAPPAPNVVARWRAHSPLKTAVAMVVVGAFLLAIGFFGGHVF
jgi:hypothetical protein